MNRLEALHILGLDEGATADDIKTAYRETVQILHPDRFAGNKKLQERATEQFKRLQEAYGLLTSEKGKSGSSRRSRGRQSGDAKTTSDRYSSDDSASSYDYAGAARTIEARLAGIAAARTQLVAQRDLVMDERRNGSLFAGIGALIMLFTIRRPFGILGVIASIATVAAVYGIVQIVTAQRTLNTLNEHINRLNAEQHRLIKELKDLET